MKSESLRVFLAIPLAPYFEASLAEYFRGKRDRFPDIRWVRPEGLHATLHFFGDVPQDSIPAITELMRPLAGTFPPLRLGLGDLGFFPDPRSPRIVWVALTGDLESLLRLARQVSRSLSHAGFESDPREFKPHATVGRTRRAGRFPDAAALPPFPGAPETSIGHFVLYRSRLQSDGAHYDVLETFPLAGRIAEN